MSEEMEVVRRGPGRPPNAERAEKAPTMAEMMEFFAAQNAANQATMLAAIAEMRKPDPDEQAKREEEKARKELVRQQHLEAAKRAEAEKAAKQAGCNHAQQNGKHAFRGQVNSDGYYRPMCSYCGWVSKPIKATDYQIREGLDLSAWPNTSANVEQFNRMAEASEKKAA